MIMGFEMTLEKDGCYMTVGMPTIEKVRETEKHANAHGTAVVDLKAWYLTPEGPELKEYSNIDVDHTPYTFEAISKFKGNK
jgi:hypothetical protein